MEVPIYLFTGFLESGKTKFIQDTIEDPRFASGEKTLLIVCEEGEEEYNPDKFADKNTTIVQLENESDLTPQRLAAFDMKYSPERVVIEYNGMWQLNTLVSAMPDNWLIYQEISFADSTTYENYNQNMRSLVVDKLNGCELIIFNRCTPATNKMALHKIVRGITRRSDIIYEDLQGEIEFDKIEDPLPFDINSKIITIEDRDYALWFRDFAEETEKYIGKTVKFKGIVGTEGGLPRDSFIIGRHVMTCCVDDIAYNGLVCIKKDGHSLKNREWITLTAKIGIQKHKAYGGKEGPVLEFIDMEPATVPEQEVATFY